MSKEQRTNPSDNVQVCQTKEDALMWFLLHEFCHLFKGYERHSHTFFVRVLAMAQENMFLFSTK